MSNEKWIEVKSYLNKVWRNPKAYPDNGLILSLSDEEATQVFTKERLKLVRLIQSKNPKNVTQLSRLAKRRLSAVIRDLELLEKFHIIDLEKTGKNIQPIIEKEIIIIPLIKLGEKTLSQIKATA